MKTRGERLKARRLEMKLTLREVAEAVDISIAGVQNLERGDVMPSLEIGIALAKCLRKPVHWVLYGTEYDPDRIPVIGTTEMDLMKSGSQDRFQILSDSCHSSASAILFMR